MELCRASSVTPGEGKAEQAARSLMNVADHTNRARRKHGHWGILASMDGARTVLSCERYRSLAALEEALKVWQVDR